MTFDTKKFIREIEGRKAIWDSSIDDYDDGDCRRRLWDEVTCSMFNNEMSEDERRDISNLLQQKWKNIRSSFTQELRRRTGKSGQTNSRRSPYVYFDNLTFLWTTVESSKDCDNANTAGQQENKVEDNIVSVQTFSPPPPKMQRVDNISDNKRDDDLDQVLNRCTAMVERSERKHNMDAEMDTDRLFILSLLDDFRNIPNKKKLSAKMEMIKLIKWAQTPQNTHWAPPRRNSHSDHDYVRDCNKTIDRSSQTQNTDENFLYEYSLSPSPPQHRISGKFLTSDSDISIESEKEDLEVIQED